MTGGAEQRDGKYRNASGDAGHHAPDDDPELWQRPTAGAAGVVAEGRDGAHQGDGFDK